MTLCKANLQTYIGLPAIIMMAFIACSKKEVNILEGKSANTPKHESEQASNPDKSTNNIREIYNPLSAVRILPETLAYFYNFYEENLYDLSGKKLKELLITDPDDPEELLELVDTDGFTSPIIGDFLSPVHINLNKEYVLPQNNANDDTLDIYVLSDGKYKEVKNGTLKALHEISPKSVANLEHDMLSGDFKPYCNFDLDKTIRGQVSEVQLFKAKDVYMGYPRAKVLISKPDRVKIIVVDLILKKIGSLNNPQQLVNESARIIGERKPLYQSFVDFDIDVDEYKTDLLRLECVSIYSGEIEINVLKNIVSSVFQNFDPNVSKTTYLKPIK